MALRNQPYFPLYVQDFMTDEGLNECSAEATGVYIKLMCLMHKSKEYGVILLKQNDKQNASTCLNFAYKLLRHLPYTVEVIERSLQELIENEVLFLDEEKGRLIQKRMVKDNEISEKRKVAGKKGGTATQNKNNFAKANDKAKVEAKTKQNTEYENEYEYKDLNNKGVHQNFVTNKPPTEKEVVDFAKGQNIKVDAAKEFFLHYDSQGWITSGNVPIKNWQNKLRLWVQNNHRFNHQQPKRKSDSDEVDKYLIKQ